MWKTLMLLIFALGTHAQRDKKFFRKDYNYLEATQSFYKIHTIPRNFYEAKAQCEDEGALLFYPRDVQELNATVGYWTESQQPLHSIVVGISSLIARGVFETVDYHPLSEVYNVFSPGEPNNLDGKENCIELRREGLMNDIPCESILPFICKKTLSSLEWNLLCDMPNIGYTYNDKTGKCYKFHLRPRTWPLAYAACSSELSYLAVIDSQVEADQLKDIIAKAPKDKIKGDYVTGAVLIGFHNRNGGGWQTIKGANLEDSGYFEWGAKQPDGGDNEVCGSIYYDGKLNDISCDSKAFFICEHDIDILKQTFDFRKGE